LGSRTSAHSISSRCTGRSDAPSAPHDRDWEKPQKQVVIILVCTLLGVSAGCSGQTPFLSGGPTVGQLKTSLSHLESENDRLKRTVAKLQQENRSIEDRLVQEQIDNGDLTARLDDARNLLRDGGLEPDVRVGSRRFRDGGDGGSADDGANGRTLPAGRAARQRRKAPFAQISGSVSELPPVHDDDEKTGESREARDAKTKRSRRRFDDDLDHHSFHSGPLRWLPVAAGTSDPTSQVR
jgi:hypothetical protein